MRGEKAKRDHRRAVISGVHDGHSAGGVDVCSILRCRGGARSRSKWVIGRRPRRLHELCAINTPTQQIPRRTQNSNMFTNQHTNLRQPTECISWTCARAIVAAYTQLPAPRCQLSCRILHLACSTSRNALLNSRTYVCTYKHSVRIFDRHPLKCHSYYTSSHVLPIHQSLASTLTPFKY